MKQIIINNGAPACRGVQLSAEAMDFVETMDPQLAAVCRYKPEWDPCMRSNPVLLAAARALGDYFFDPEGTSEYLGKANSSLKLIEIGENEIPWVDIDGNYSDNEYLSGTAVAFDFDKAVGSGGDVNEEAFAATLNESGATYVSEKLGLVINGGHADTGTLLSGKTETAVGRGAKDGVWTARYTPEGLYVVSDNLIFTRFHFEVRTQETDGHGNITTRILGSFKELVDAEEAFAALSGKREEVPA